MIKIGIIGDIGSGKSYVAKRFGYPVFNADVEVGKLYKKNRKIFNKLRKKLPKYIYSFPINKDEICEAILENKTNLNQFEDFVDRLYKAELTDLTILEDLSEYTMRYNENDEEDIEVGNTSAFLEEYVDGMKVDEEKPKIKKLLQVIYDEALNVDTAE